MRRNVRVALLADDLAERCADEPDSDAALRAEWTAARDAKRTAAEYGPWRAERLTQAAVGWPSRESGRRRTSRPIPTVLTATGYLDGQRQRHNLTGDDLRDWRPPQRRRR